MAEAVQVVTSSKMVMPPPPGQSNEHNAATFYRLGMLEPFSAETVRKSNDQTHSFENGQVELKAKSIKSSKSKKKLNTEAKIDPLTSPSVMISSLI